MRFWKDRPPILRGRLHGRAYKLLGVFTAIVVAVAVWLMAVSMGGDTPDSSERDLADPLLSGIPDQPAGGESDDVSATASASASPSPTAEETTGEPEESTGDEETSDSAPEPDEETGAGLGCTASLHLDREWSDTISVTVEVANSGAEGLDGWEVVLDLEGVEVTAAWGMGHVEGDRYRNGWFNGDLDPGESGDASFNGETEDAYELPQTVPCSPAAS